MPAQKRLNRDDMVGTALALADAEGLDAVTIRRVAQQHDATAMALYRHFPGKEGLLDAIAERLLGDARVPAPDGRPWYEQMSDLLTSILDALRPHPNAAALVTTRVLASEPGLALAERTLGLLAEAGVPLDQSAEIAGQALCSLVTLVVTEPGRPYTDDPEQQEAALRAKRAYLLGLSPHRYPHVVAATDALVACASEESYYRRAVDMMVTGMRGVPNSAAPVAG